MKYLKGDFPQMAGNFYFLLLFVHFHKFSNDENARGCKNASLSLDQQITARCQIERKLNRYLCENLVSLSTGMAVLHLNKQTINILLFEERRKFFLRSLLLLLLLLISLTSVSVVFRWARPSNMKLKLYRWKQRRCWKLYELLEC